MLNKLNSDQSNCSMEIIKVRSQKNWALDTLMFNQNQICQLHTNIWIIIKTLWISILKKHDFFGTSIKNKYQKAFKHTSNNSAHSPMTSSLLGNSSLFQPQLLRTDSRSLTNQATDIPSR